MFVCINLLPVAAFAEAERDVLREAGPIQVDAKLEDWTAHPFEIYGLMETEEPKLGVVAQQAWSKEGLWFAFRAHCETGPAAKSGGATSDSIEFFVDTRPATARMDRYEAGVFRLVWLLPADARSAGLLKQIDGNGRNIEAPALKSCRLAAQKAKDGWTAECFVPWEALGGFEPAENRWIGLSVRILHSEENGRKRYTVGARTVDPDSRLEARPMAFRPVRLGPASRHPAEPIACFVEEKIIQGEPWLEIEAAALDRGDALPTLQVQIEAMGLRKSYRFMPSLSQRYRFVRERVPLKDAGLNASAVRVRIASDGDDWKREWEIGTAAAARWAALDRELPDERIEALPEAERSMARLLKEAARESVTLLSTGAREGVAPRKTMRAAIEPGCYDERIALYRDFALQFIRGRRLDPTFPYVAWRSATDDTWQPIKLVYPWNFDPRKRYPAKLLIYGRSRERTRAQFMEADLFAARSGQYQPYANDYFSLVLYGRGNSHVELGQEEIDYVFEKLLPSLPVDLRCVSIYGGSFGAVSALQLAIDQPDRFALVNSRAGYFGAFLRGNGEDGSRQLLRNLLHSAVFMTVGSEEKQSIEPAEEMEQICRELGVACACVQLPDTAHLFTPPDPPAELLGRPTPVRPRHVVFSTSTPDTGKSYWLTIARLRTWGERATIEGNVADRTLQIAVENVGAFTVDLRDFADDEFPLTIEIAGKPVHTLSARTSSGRAAFVAQGDTWTYEGEAFPADAAGALAKKRGSCGPARQVEMRKMLIVYGTKDPRRTWYLRERAFAVVAARIGPDLGQWAGGHREIRADDEVKPEDVSTCNLWLIGGPAENAVTASCAAGLPLQLGDDGVVLLDRRFNHPHTLLSYVYPSPLAPERYVYVEWGRSEASYLGEVLRTPTHDICVQEINPGDPSLVFKGSFDAAWKLSETP